MRRIPAALLLTALGSVGCWVPIEQGLALEKDLVRMDKEVRALALARAEDTVRFDRESEKLRGDQEAAVRRVDAKVREVGETLDSLNRAARKTGADLSMDLEKTQQEVSRLRGQVEESQARQKGLEDDLARLRTELAALLDKQRLQDDHRRKQAEAAAEEARRAAERPASKDDFYKVAKEKLDAGEFASARQLFGEFIVKWKDDPLAANAQYWLGESLYAERRWKESVQEFRKVSEQYPKSEKAPDALLKISFAFIEMGLVDDAKLFLDEIVKAYPKANAAKLAKDKLSELGRRK